MAKLQLNRSVGFAVTQGSADAFASVTLNTGLSTAANIGWEIKRVEFYIDPALLASISADASVEIALVNPSVAPGSISDFNDDDTICQFGFANALTTSGEVIINSNFTWEAPPGTIVVESAIYAIIDSTATGVALVLQGKVHYETVELAEIEFLRLLSSRT